MKPILFSTPMVQAILSGKKTMTRRIVKPQPGEDCEAGKVPIILGNEDDWGKWYWDTEEGERILKFCPYGMPGDILWVRESFYDCSQVEQPPCDLDPSAQDYMPRFSYKADHDDWEEVRWRPSIHMPKEACRLFLKVKSISIERLQDISEEDARSEGAGPATLHNQTGNYTHKYGFQRLWYEINGHESWNANPWVWVIEFESVEKPKNWTA